MLSGKCLAKQTDALYKPCLDNAELRSTGTQMCLSELEVKVIDKKMTQVKACGCVASLAGNTMAFGLFVLARSA